MKTGEPFKILNKLDEYIPNGFWVVGGMAYSVYFNPQREICELDICLKPKGGNPPRVLPELKRDFYVTHIDSENFGGIRGFYFRVRDKKSLMKVDLFMPYKELASKQINLGGSIFEIPIPEELYLHLLNEFWQWLNTTGYVGDKHIRMLETMRNSKLDASILKRIFSEDENARGRFLENRLRKGHGDLRVLERKFDSLEEYESEINLLIKKVGKELPKQKQVIYPGKQEGWGIQNEEEELFLDIER